MVTVRTMIEHERKMYAEGCRLLQDEGMTHSDDPFGIRLYAGGQRELRDSGVPNAGRYRSWAVIALGDHAGVVGIAGMYPHREWVNWAATTGSPEDLERALFCTHLANMVVRPDLRGQGIGGRMLDHAVTVAADDGYRMFTGFASGDLERLVPFYRRHGMTVDVEGDGRPPESIFGPFARLLARTPRKGYYFWRDLSISASGPALSVGE